MIRSIDRWLLAGGLSLATISFTGLEVCAQQQAATPTPMVEPATPEERERQRLYDELTRVGETLVREAQSPSAWVYQVQQAELLMNLAYRSQGEEREKLLRMAVDTFHSATVQSPEKETAALERMQLLPGYLRQHFPNSELHTYAAVQGVRAEHARMLQFTSVKSEEAQERLAIQLLLFVQNHPNAKESVPSIEEAARIFQGLGKSKEAGRCYQALAEKQPGTEAARLARRAIRKLGGLNGEVISFTLPQLYRTASDPRPQFDLKGLRGNWVVLHFWSAENAEAWETFEAIKQLSDRYRPHGLAVVNINLDAAPAIARDFLSGKLVSGTHVVQEKGLASPLAEHLGLEKLPELMLLTPEGALEKAGLTPTQLEEVLSAQFPTETRRK